MVRSGQLSDTTVESQYWQKLALQGMIFSLRVFFAPALLAIDVPQRTVATRTSYAAPSRLSEDGALFSHLYYESENRNFRMCVCVESRVLSKRVHGDG